MKFTINRKKWARGGKNGRSALLNDKGNMCCLGFFGLACGLKKREIKGLAEPADVEKWPRKGRWLLSKRGGRQPPPPRISCHLMTANDTCGTDEATREAEIKRLFKKHRVEVIFRG